MTCLPSTCRAKSQVEQGRTELELGSLSELAEKVFRNLREEIAMLIHDLLHHMLATGEDDTKALISIANVSWTLKNLCK